jgi:hypothetical protein
VLAALIGCGFGYSVGATSSAGVVVSQDPEVVGDLGEVCEQVRGLAIRFGRMEAMLSSRVSDASSRRLVSDPHSDQLASSELQSAVDLLEQRIAAFSHRLAGVDPESLRIARVQNPQPKLAVAEAFGRALREAPSEEARWSVARKWLMMAMDAVIVELGLPTTILMDRLVSGRQAWEYIQPDGELVTLTFQDGLVVRVDG